MQWTREAVRDIAEKHSSMEAVVTFLMTHIKDNSVIYKERIKELFAPVHEVCVVSCLTALTPCAVSTLPASNGPPS